MATILVPLPNRDFDPTEAAVPWQILRAAGHTLVFATPDGRPAAADPIMVTGERLGILSPILRANTNGRDAYADLEKSPEFQRPIPYSEIATANFTALLLPGGHAPGMKTYLESELIQSKVVEFFDQGKPVGAICHGVLVAARSRTSSGKSVLYGKKTTALLKRMEMAAWVLTCGWLGQYYRTYRQTVEDEVKAALASPDDFKTGNMGFTRDSLESLSKGFAALDGKYLSARWPGDAHRFGMEFVALLSRS